MPNPPGAVPEAVEFGHRPNLVDLITPDETVVGLGVLNQESVDTRILGDFAAHLKLSNTGPTGATIDAKIQESPDPPTVADADATWYDLVTFAQQIGAAGTSEKKTVTDPHFSRMRLVLDYGSTGTTADVECKVEGFAVS
jgi:hypothetical protein